MSKKIINNVQLGSDFELFLYDNDAKQYINAKPFIKGSKEAPFNFDRSNPFWRTCLDNVLAEGNIKPARTRKEFVDGINKVMNYIKSIVPKNVSLHAIPAVDMPEDELNSPESVEIGCEVDYNAYTLSSNPTPILSSNLRSAALHIHLSYDDMNLITSTEWIKAMDLFLGLPSIMIEPDNKRRDLYGNAGAYRISPVTTEYRVLSNFFLKDDNLINWVYNNTLLAIDFINNNQTVPVKITEKVLSLFKSKDKEAIRTFITENNIKLPV